MSIQRYQPFPYDRWMRTDLGNFVAYDDHVAAVTDEAVKWARAAEAVLLNERARIRQAIEGIRHLLEGATVEEVLSIIDGDAGA